MHSPTLIMNSSTYERQLVPVGMGELETSLHMAANENRKDLVKMLLKKKVDVNCTDKKNGWTSLHCAAYSGYFQICELLLKEEGIDASITNKDGTTALHYLVRHELTSSDMRACFKRVLELMVEKGARVDEQTKNGETALHNACFKGNEDAIVFLLSKNANIDLRNKLGETPLYYAIRGNHINIVKLLIEKGASLLEDSEDEEILQFASPEVLALLSSARSKKELNRKNSEEEQKIPTYLVGRFIRITISRAIFKNYEEGAKCKHHCELRFNNTAYHSSSKSGIAPKWKEKFTCSLLQTNTPISLAVVETKERQEIGVLYLLVNELELKNSNSVTWCYLRNSSSSSICGRIKLKFKLLNSEAEASTSPKEPTVTKKVLQSSTLPSKKNAKQYQQLLNNQAEAYSNFFGEEQNEPLSSRSRSATVSEAHNPFKITNRLEQLENLKKNKESSLSKGSPSSGNEKRTKSRYALDDMSITGSLKHLSYKRPDKEKGTPKKNSKPLLTTSPSISDEPRTPCLKPEHAHSGVEFVSDSGSSSELATGRKNSGPSRVAFGSEPRSPKHQSKSKKSRSKSKSGGSRSDSATQTRSRSLLAVKSKEKHSHKKPPKESKEKEKKKKNRVFKL